MNYNEITQQYMLCHVQVHQECIVLRLIHHNQCSDIHFFLTYTTRFGCQLRTLAYILPSMWAVKYHTHTKQQAKSYFCIS